MEASPQSLPVREQVALRTACRCTVALLLAVTLGFSVSPQPSNPLEIPLHLSRAFGLMLVTAEINGKPAVLIVDTGSNHTAISSRFVDVASPSLRDTVSTEKGSGYSGRGVFTKASLKLGPVLWRDHRVLAMDMKEISRSFGENIDGFLGMDFLNEFEMVVVDLRQHKLIITQ
jgi:predicted aspartyl protease